MSLKKRFYFPENVDKDDFEGCSSCFMVNPDVELKDVPTTGEEYLLKVMNESKRASFVSRTDEDLTKYIDKQTCFAPEVPYAKAPLSLKPTIEWQNIQVADFSDTRMYISRMLENKSLWPDLSNHDRLSINPNNIAVWKNMFQNREPTLSYILGVHSSLIDNGLEILIQMLDDIQPGETIDYKTGQWIYALLACLRQPLVSDTIGILRDLVRKCAEIRSHLDPDDEASKTAVTPLNLFICLISRYFRQYDLAD